MTHAHIHRPIFNTVRALVLAIAVLSPLAASAHPDDEFCAVGSSLDPALCRALAATDSSQSQPVMGVEFDTDASWTSVFIDFIGVGFEHILPLGLDHILFILALFLASRRFKDLVIQVSLFTLAHTLTLGLGAAGLFTAPPDIVEPVIALSIVALALEAAFRRKPAPWCPVLIFGFGLFHGLGFASMLNAQLVESAFLPALIGFNIGVELGQLTVLAGAAIVLFAAAFGVRLTGSSASVRAAITQPIALTIAAIGAYWAVERVFF